MSRMRRATANQDVKLFLTHQRVGCSRSSSHPAPSVIREIQRARDEPTGCDQSTKGTGGFARRSSRFGLISDFWPGADVIDRCLVKIVQRPSPRANVPLDLDLRQPLRRSSGGYHGYFPAETGEVLGESCPALTSDRPVRREVIGDNQETTRRAAARYSHVDWMSLPLANSEIADLFRDRSARAREMQ